MDSCKLAENLIMKHIENSLVPKEANTLAKHVLKCKTCREFYLAIDKAAEIEIVEAPANFAASVMERIKLEPLAERQTALSWVKKAAVSGIGLILIAIAFILAYSPTFAPAMTIFFGEVLAVLFLVRDFAVDIIRLFTPEVNLNITLISFAALVLMLISGGLAFVLQQGDKEKSLA